MRALLAVVLVAALSAPAKAAPRYDATARFLVFPVGLLHSGLSGEKTSSSAEPAYGVAASLDRYLSRRFSIGLEVPVIFHEKAKNLVIDPATEVAALLRASEHLPLSRSVTLVAAAAAGAYRIVTPDGGASGVSFAAGLQGEWLPRRDLVPSAGRRCRNAILSEHQT